MSDKLEFHPATAQNWPDLVAFFQQYGNPNYCWCTRWRLKSADFKNAKATQRREKLESLVKDKIPVGMLAYDQDKVIGWCSIAPRESYALLESSTTLKRLDDLPAWSVVCFFIDPAWRGKNLSARLLHAAVEYATAQGAAVIEGYPVEAGQSYQFMGSPSAFEQVGFHEAGIAKNGRRIVRFFADEDHPKP